MNLRIYSMNLSLPKKYTVYQFRGFVIKNEFFILRNDGFTKKILQCLNFYNYLVILESRLKQRNSGLPK